MRAKRNETSARPAVARLFEVSRHAGADLAIAFEQVLPVTRRAAGRPCRGQATPDHVHLRRRAGS
jgi:hypothetical protein